MSRMIFKTKREEAFLARKEAIKAERELHEKKEIAFYSGVMSAWFSTRMELDRSLLTLSATGVGLLITLLKYFGARSLAVTIFYSGAIICFCTCIAAVLWIFKRNGDHLIDLVQSDSTNDRQLERLDKYAPSAFFIGIVLSAAIGISAAISPEPKDEVSNSTTKEESMTEQKKSQDGRTVGRALAQDSLSGASGLRPTNTLKTLRESVNGASKLKPVVPQSSQHQTSGASQNSNSAPVSSEKKGG